jgi:hypothetical protein
MPRITLFLLVTALAGCSGLLGLKDVTFVGGDGGTGGADGQQPDAAPAPDLYWAELPMACDSTAIRRMAIDGTTPFNVLMLPPPDEIQDLAVDQIGQKIYYSYSGSSANQMEDVERVNLDGSAREPLKTYGTRPSPVGVDVDPAADTIYWIANEGCSPCPSASCACSTIQKARRDGSSAQTVYTITGTFNPRMVAVDPQARKLYWSDTQFAPQIQRANVDGSMIEPVYTKPASPDGGGVDVLQVDLVGHKLYWLEHALSINGVASIQRSNLDGSSVERIVFPLGGAQDVYPRGLAVDAASGKLYWTESNFCGAATSGRIRRANLDGSGVETVISGLGVLVSIRIVHK